MHSALELDRSRRRAIEIVVGAATWGTVTAPLWAALLVPHLWVYAFLAFSFYWLYRSGSLALYAVIGYRRMKTAQARDWLGDSRDLPGWHTLHQLVVVPSHREPTELLIDTLEHLDAQDFPHDRMSVLLAFEERDPEALDKARLLVGRFGRRFGNLWVTVHPSLPNEPPGKAANLAYAVPRAREWLAQSGRVDAERVLVTVCDADSRLHPKHLSALAHAWLSDPHGGRCLYQPAMIFHANIDRIPAPLRAMDALYSIVQLARLVSTYKLVTQSTYSLSLSACHAIGYWDPNVVPEDSHTYFKMFFTWGKQTRVHPLYLPVLADAAESTSIWKTILSHYRQARRWSWGVSDVPYVLAQTLRQRHIDWKTRYLQAGHYCKEHFLWPTHWFLLALGLRLTPTGTSESPLSAAQLEVVALSSSVILASSLFLFFPLYIDRRLRWERGGELSFSSAWQELVSWMALPALGLPLMVLPALDAHTRLLLGQRLGYDVTEKLFSSRRPPRPRLPITGFADQRVA